MNCPFHWRYLVFLIICVKNGRVWSLETSMSLTLAIPANDPTFAVWNNPQGFIVWILGWSDHSNAHVYQTGLQTFLIEHDQLCSPVSHGPDLLTSGPFIRPMVVCMRMISHSGVVIMTLVIALWLVIINTMP